MSDEYSVRDLEQQIAYLVSYGRRVSALLEGLNTPFPKLREEELRTEWRQSALSDKNMQAVLDMLEGSTPPPRG